MSEPDTYDSTVTDSNTIGNMSIPPGYTYLGNNITLNGTFSFTGDANSKYLLVVGNRLNATQSFMQNMGASNAGNVVWMVRGDATLLLSGLDVLMN